MSLVSVCIPVYNNRETIELTVKSVIAQTYRPIELIIVDDCSTDDSVETIRNYLKDTNTDIDINIVENSSNLGMAGNWNKCLSLCKGDYIKLLCADDTIAPTLIEREVKVLVENPDVISVESDTGFLTMEGKVNGRYLRYRKSGVVDGKEIARYSLFHRDYYGAPLANLFRREAYEKLGGFDPEFNYILDYEFFMRLGCEGNVYIIREVLNYFRLRQGSNTAGVFKGEEGKRYVEEHRKLAVKYKDKLGLSSGDIARSVRIRKFMSFLGLWYFRLHLKR